jgi:hypothetical protein
MNPVLTIQDFHRSTIFSRKNNFSLFIITALLAHLFTKPGFFVMLLKKYQKITVFALPLL